MSFGKSGLFSPPVSFRCDFKKMAPVPITIDNTLGAVLVGFAVSCCVYGILITQIYVYFSRYPEDRLVYKFLVSLLSAIRVWRHLNLTLRSFF